MNAEEYMEHWIKNKVWTHYKWPKHQQRFKQIASMCEGKTFLDVGCGLGHSTIQLRKFKPGPWAGCDFSEIAIKKARQLFMGTRFYFCDRYDLLWCISEKFDTVVCSEVIEHIEDDRTFIEELIKIANIKVVLTTPNRMVDDPGHLRVYGLDSLQELLSGYAFRIKSIGNYFYVGLRI